MHLRNILRAIASAVPLLFASLVAAESTLPSAEAVASQKKDEESTVVLNPFEVKSAQDKGYRASNSVTATGIGAAIKDIPANISVLTEEYLNDRAVFDLRDAVKNLPSVSAGNRTDDMKVRGFAAVVEQDGVAGGQSPTYDLNRIEVVRGPSSIFHGASRPGGVVNVIRNTAEFKWRADVNVQEGNFSLHREEFGITGPLIKDMLAFRVYGANFERGGPYEYQSRDENYYRGVVRFQPFRNNKVTFTAAFSHFERDWHVMQAPPVTHPAFVEAVRAGTVEPLTPQRTWLNNNPLYGPDTPQGVIFATDIVFPRPRYNPDGRTDIRDNDIATFNLTLTPARWLSVQARYTDSEDAGDVIEFNLFRPFAGFRPGQFVYRTNASWQKSLGKFNDARVEATLRFPIWRTQHQLFLGASRVRSGGASRTLNALPIVFDPMVDPTPNHRAAVLANNPAGFPVLSVTAYDVSRSFYATDQIAVFNGNLRLLAGARRAEVKQTNGKITKQTTPQFGGLVKARKWLSLYGNYGKVFEPNNLRDGAGNPVPPVTGVGAEAGLKTDAFEGRLSFTASIYRSDRKNVARQDFSKQMETGIIPYYTLGGLERNEGFEFETILSPTDNLQTILTYAYSWNHKTIESTGEIRQVGVSIDFVPDHQVTLWQVYHFSSPKLKGLSIGGGVKWVKQIDRLHPTWDIAVSEDGYTKVDLFARYSTKIFGKEASLQVNADNLFSASYYDHVYILAEPLTFIASLRFRL